MAESQALAHLFHRFGPMIYRRARLLVGPGDSAQEVVRDVFLMLAATGGLPEAGREVRALVRLTTLCSLQRMRLERHTPKRSVAGDVLQSFRPVLANADERAAEAALLVYVDGMSVAEAAELLGVAPTEMQARVSQFDQWMEAEAGDDAAVRTEKP